MTIKSIKIIQFSVQSSDPIRETKICHCSRKMSTPIQKIFCRCISQQRADKGWVYMYDIYSNLLFKLFGEFNGELVNSSVIGDI